MHVCIYIAFHFVFFDSYNYNDQLTNTFLYYKISLNYNIITIGKIAKLTELKSRNSQTTKANAKS